MSERVRISKNPSEHDAFMNLTDDLQKTVLTLPDTLRYTLFGWTELESAQWTLYRETGNALYALVSNPDTASTTNRKKMTDHIAEVRSYDNNKLTGHHLLDKVGLNGTVDDWRTFNVKRGTTLQAEPVRHAEEEVSERPVIVLKALEPGAHILSVSDADNPGSKKLPEGMAFAKVYRYIGTEATTDLDLYKFIDNAKLGEVTSDFTGVVQPGTTKIYAWYYGRYESKKGKLGMAGAIIRVEIVLIAP